MITRRLVLVLGAGASYPFGFPLGIELKDQITGQTEESGSGGMYPLLQEAGFGQQQIRDFGLALKKSGKQSVDAFLEHRLEFLDVGKAAIAWNLLVHENERNLFDNMEGDWYQYLFGKLNTRFEEFDKNSLSVITFNYDRSLEHYLFTALRNAYGKSPDECVAKLRSLPIVHLYGKLGDLPYMASHGVEFGRSVKVDKLRKAAQGIQIIHEGVADKPQFQQAHTLFDTAERICFLGFGYDPVNLQRLMGGVMNREQEIGGSAFSFTDGECRIVERQFRNLGFRKQSSLNLLRADSITFLRNFCPFDWD